MLLDALGRFWTLRIFRTLRTPLEHSGRPLSLDSDPLGNPAARYQRTHVLSTLTRSLRYNNLDAAAENALTDAAKRRAAPLDLRL